MNHEDTDRRADQDSNAAIDAGKRKLLKRGKLALPAVFTLQVSYSAWASSAELDRVTTDPRMRGRKF